MSHPYGWLSVLPPIVAIVLAIVTRRALASLLAGIFCGALITRWPHPVLAAVDFMEVHLWPALIDPEKLRVFAFTLLMGSMIGVIVRSRGMLGLVQLIAPLARSRRGGQLTAWLMGLVIFFDDYANTVLLGGTLRPLCDRLGISREKLAYLVDSTAAPVAGLSLLSTWVAVEIAYIDEGLATIGSGTSLTAMDLFVGSIPYRFYVLCALVLIPLLAIAGRDFGPMLAAERKKLRGRAEDVIQPEEDDLEGSSDGAPARWFNAALPIMLTLAVVLWLMYVTGKEALFQAGLPAVELKQILGAARTGLALQYGALAGLLASALLARFQQLLTGGEIMSAMGAGARVMLPALAILWCASALSRMTGHTSYDQRPTTVAYEHRDHRLYTGDFLTQLVAADEGESNNATWTSTTVRLLPTAVFLLAALLSFATGTSFGTMGILLPMVIPLAHGLLASEGDPLTGSHPIMLGTIGGVLAGAIFGDHCSPISDTTILSSQSCACDHIAHVVTQLPYALTAGAVTVLAGTLPLGWGASLWVLLPIQFGLLAAVVLVAGRKA